MEIWAITLESETYSSYTFIVFVKIVLGFSEICIKGIKTMAGKSWHNDTVKIRNNPIPHWIQGQQWLSGFL